MPVSPSLNPVSPGAARRAVARVSALAPALGSGQIWRTHNSRFIWILGAVRLQTEPRTPSPNYWRGIDLESGALHIFIEDTRTEIGATADVALRLTRVYGNMREPTFVPTELAQAPGTQGVPAVARINRAVVQLFSGRTVAKARPGRVWTSRRNEQAKIEPKIQEVVSTPAAISSTSNAPALVTVHYVNGHQDTVALKSDPALFAGDVVRVASGQYFLITGVGRSTWKYFGRPASRLGDQWVGSGHILSWLADGTDPGDKRRAITQVLRRSNPTGDWQSVR